MKGFVVGVGTAMLLIVYRLLCLLPMRDRIVCLSRQSDDEPLDFKLIREYVGERHPGWDVVVLAKKLGSPVAYLPHMLRQLYYIATSRAVVLDSYCIVVSLLAGHLRVPVVQMWHAMGNMKKFGYTAIGQEEGRPAETARLMRMHKGYTSVLISSMSFVDDYAAGFGVDPGIIYEAPLPRADLLLDAEYAARERARIEGLYPELSGKRNIVYAPTFRREPAPNEAEAMARLVESVDFDRYNLIYMAHPVSTQRLDDPRVLQGYDRSCNMLFAADYVISDYSTVIYEAGLLGLPVYLYAYDWDTYSERRSLNIDIEHDVPALFSDDPWEIMDAIGRDRFDAAAFGRFIARNVAVPAEGSCTERVVEHILALCETGGCGQKGS